MRCWGCGGTGNNTLIQFEICEPKDYSDRDYFLQVKETALQLCKYLIKEFNLSVANVTSHCEGYKNYGKTFASNHSDLDHWWKKYFNYTMDDFRIELTRSIKEDEMADIPELSIVEKQNKIKEIMNIDDNTIQFLSFYKYNVPLFDKMYYVCVDAEKWRKMAKN